MAMRLEMARTPAQITLSGRDLDSRASHELDERSHRAAGPPTQERGRSHAQGGTCWPRGSSSV